MADFVRPQASRVEMCPPQAMTAVELALATVKVIAMLVSLLVGYVPFSVYAPAAVIVPPYSAKL